jgi:hypothetical protein
MASKMLVDFHLSAKITIPEISDAWKNVKPKKRKKKFKIV